MKPEIRRLPSALNAFLPGDIVARDCSEEDDSFNARRSALAREYIYYIHLSRFPSPFNRRFTYHCDSTLDLENMASALEMTVGKRDFAAFARSERGKTTVREVQEAGIFAKGDIVAIQVRANAFIWMMMRMLCGSLLEVGRGKWSIDRFHEALESCDNSNSAAALPPHGLVLEQVHY
ncbi:MAG: hypothetical protein A2V52_08265 [Actinobacteria bacterium RBG_19FT_COMBO_54_7]|nr:MAG: hypothetical protein A2V52_08265 [Actinobacteria bacterium RBG_19FT_COMBO_54_7]